MRALWGASSGASAASGKARYYFADALGLSRASAKCHSSFCYAANTGDPLAYDFHTPPHLIEVVARAMRDGKNGYAPSLGVVEALEAVRAEAERKGIRNVQSVFITQGVSEAVDVCLTALVNAGENLLAPSPEYPLYSAVLAKLGASPNSYELDEGAGWQPDLEQLAGHIFTGTRGMVVIN